MEHLQDTVDMAMKAVDAGTDKLYLDTDYEGTSGLALDISDVIANLMVLAHVKGVDFDSCMDRANRHFVEEVKEPLPS